MFSAQPSLEPLPSLAAVREREVREERGGLGHLQRPGGSKQGTTEKGSKSSSCPFPTRNLEI